MLHKTCPCCKREFDSKLVHGNAKYCSYDCYYESKINKSIECYNVNKMLISKINHCDLLLERFNETYGAGNFIDALALDKAGFDWLISQGIIYGNGLPYTIINRYAYALFENKQLLIWKIK